MKQYRILISPSGTLFCLQYQTESLLSMMIRFFFPDYPIHYHWKYITSDVGTIVKFYSLELAQKALKEVKKNDLDSNINRWKPILENKND